MNREPLVTAASITALAAALITLIVQFGVSLTEGQQTAILAVVGIVAPLAVGFIARRKVSPTSEVRAQLDAEGNTVNPNTGAQVHVTKILGKA